MAHNVRFGVEVRKYYYDQDSARARRAISPSRPTRPPTRAPCLHRLLFASFLLGAPSRTALNITPVNPSRGSESGVLRDGRLEGKPKLTLNLGLRWDIVGALYEIDNRSSGSIRYTPNPGADGYPGLWSF